MRLRSLVRLLVVAACVAAPAGASAQGWIQPEQPIPGFAVQRLRTHVQVRVVDRIAQVEVEEWFENRGGRLAEGIYRYPLPGETVFQNYSLFQGDLELTGETMDADRARAIYEEIVRKRRDPALIELVGHGLIQARVFPIAAGETRRIVLRYTQLLERAGDALAFRYDAGGPARAGASGAPRLGEQAPLTFAMTVEGETQFLDPFSPTHGLSIAREDGTLRVRPSDDVSGDFVVFLPPAGDPVRLALSTHRASSDDGFFMLTLSPGEVAESAVPRDLTMVVDVSGSMSGEKIEQTRRALVQLLGSLGPGDRFRLIRFSNTVGAYASGWTPATADQVRLARAWIEDLRAEGGTNIAGALDEALRARSPEGRLPMLVFLTDGLPTVGEENPDALAAMADRLRGRTRVFAFGVGYDVDTVLLDRLTIAGRGGVEYVGPGEDVERSLGLLAAKVQHPVLADLALGDAPVRLTDIYPTDLPDLFAGEALTIFGRYTGAGEGRLSVAGTREDRVERFAAQVAFPAHEAANDFIPRLWAARKIGELTRAVRVNGPEPEVVDKIRRTALRFGILTEYTSYLVLEPEMAADGAVRAPAAPAEAPRAGRPAVLGSAAANAARQASRADQVAALEELALDAAEATRTQPVGGTAMPEMRVAAGRAFVLRDGIWVDRTHADRARTVDVQAFSAAYFDLLAALPELESWLGAFPQVVVAGERVSVRVSDIGATTLTAAEIDDIVRAFHGA